MTTHAIITINGASEQLAQELQDLGIKAKRKGIDWCEANLTADNLVTIKTSSHITVRVLELIGTAHTEEELDTLAATVKPTGSFSVRSNGGDRQEREIRLGAIIHDTTGVPVNLTKPETPVFCHETDGVYLFGIDKTGDLTKRHYKIITGATSLSGPFAAAALRMAGWKKTKDLVVWPCAAGELAIEAALQATGKSPRAYELRILESHEPTCKILCADPHLSMLRTSEKNSVVAGVAKAITFSRQDLDWLDTKHTEHAITLLIGLLPNLAYQKGFAEELMYQLDYILAPKGYAVFICVNEASVEKIEQAAKNYVATKQYLWLGQQCHTLVTLVRKTKKGKAPK